VISSVLFQLVNGIVWGCIMALVALGLSLIFGQMGVINMAHGEFYMVGAVGLFLIMGLLNSFWPAVLLVGVVMMAAGALLERTVMRPFEGKPTPSMIATIGLSYVIQQLALIFFGGTPKQVVYPISGVLALGSLRLPTYRVVVAGIALVLMAGLWLLLYRTNLGTSIRACMQDRDTAEALGINTGRVSTLTFGLGAGLAGVGGALAAPVSQVFFLMGSDVVLFAFIVVIVGGLGSLKGALVAAVGLSAVEGLLNTVVSPVRARALVFLLMAVVLMVRPRGLFGRSAS
jgi:branched-chain amino acid transport system permease protein